MLLIILERKKLKSFYIDSLMFRLHIPFLENFVIGPTLGQQTEQKVKYAGNVKLGKSNIQQKMSP